MHFSLACVEEALLLASAFDNSDAASTNPAHPCDNLLGCYELGQLSCYGDEGMVLLRHLAKQGKLDRQGKKSGTG
jgi:hypothetical protein